MIARIPFLILLAVACGQICLGETIYVDDSAGGANDGSSWANAYTYLQDAISTAFHGDTILVAQGTYTPDLGAGQVSGDRGATFSLKNGVILRGGYAGAGEPNPNARDIGLYTTILSGDLNGNDVEVSGIEEQPDAPSRLDNSYRIVTSIGNDLSCVLDGFMVTSATGGAMRIREGISIENCIFTANVSSAGAVLRCDGYPILTNCTFIDNIATRAGGVLHTEDEYMGPAFIKCFFIRNVALGEGGCGYGGAIFNDETGSWSPTTFIGCTFDGNKAEVGGAIANVTGGGAAHVENSVFTNNTAADCGGAIYSTGSDHLTIIGSLFEGNLASEGGAVSVGRGCAVNSTFRDNLAEFGGAICSYSRDSSFANCVFTGNSADYSGGIFYQHSGNLAVTNCSLTGGAAVEKGGAIYVSSGGTDILNSILWDNSARTGNQLYLLFQQVSHPTSVFVGHSDIPTGVENIVIEPGAELVWGGGNIEADPMFVGPESGDLRLRRNSACIDAGDNNNLPADVHDLDGDGDVAEPIPFDLDGNPRITEGIVDMGAYEFLQQILEAVIDIKPGSYPNPVNLDSKGLLPVAILSSGDFDATTIDPATAQLADARVAVRGKKGVLMVHIEDVNSDSLGDLVLHFETQALDPACLRTGAAVLTAATYDGTIVEGGDDIVLVPSHK